MEGIPYTEAFVKALMKAARKDPKVVAITAAMPSGTGLNAFQKMLPVGNDNVRDDVCALKSPCRRLLAT